MKILFLISISVVLINGFQKPVVISKSIPELFPLSIIHINDFHARFEETNQYGGPCPKNSKCIGGYARTVSKVRELLSKYKDNNPIYLNAGDSFQGTLWYNLGRWNVTQQFLNILNADATTIGNHEFDNGIDGLVPFLKTLKSPVVAANIDDSAEPSIQGLYKKSVVIERSGRKIGIIGVVLQSYKDIANTEKLVFLSETESIIAEAEKLNAKGVDIIIVLSHCGYDVDQIIAKNGGPLIDVIVGAHSHTFLYSGPPPGPEKPRGPYPTQVIQDTTNHSVLIVQASAYSKYVGDLTLYFNDNGNVVTYIGNPHYLSNDVKQDPEVLQALIPWKIVIDAKGREVIGRSAVRLTNRDCGSGECNLGNLFTDALIDYFVRKTPMSYPYWSTVSIAIINRGALRIPLERGNLTYNHLVSMSPFENKIQAFNLPGHVLIEALEYSIESNSYLPPLANIERDLNSSRFNARNMLQVSGLRIIYNVTNPYGKRIKNILVRCQKCDYPKYEKFEKNKIYRIATVDFLGSGGDGFHMIRDFRTDVENGETEIEALINYVRSNSPITTGKDGRITVIDKINSVYDIAVLL